MTESSEKENGKGRLSEKGPKSSGFLPAFLLGGLVALAIITISTVSGIYWTCKDVPSSPVLECPTIISKKEKRKANFGGLLKRKPSDDDPIELEIASPNPTHCACRLFLGFFNGNGQITTPFSTCFPTEKETVSTRPSSELMQKYKVAFTPEYLPVPKENQQLISKLADQVEREIPNFEERASKVQWGRSDWPWYVPTPKTGEATDLEKVRGGSLFFSYLRIMKWPQSLQSKFPFKLCSEGCNSEVAIGHTLQFREKFRPWMHSPAVMKENEKGFIFFHGFSGSRDESENSSHSIVWIRSGLRNKRDDAAQTRAYVNTLERAVAASLARSNGRVGKFNVVIDGTGFSFRLMPSLHHVKIFITILQDHYPDRLGIILLTNLGSVGEILVKMFLNLITEEVRNKVIVLPQDPRERQIILNTVVKYENSPTWLGGTDAYQFNPKEYYANPDLLFSDEEAMEYIETMPYHS